MYPLTFDDKVVKALWGDEHWTVSAHPKGCSIVSEGELKGRTLAELMPNFPLLIKIIESRARSSVQVHPNETTCKITGGDPKTEMWCILSDGFIYAGFKEGVGPDDVRKAIAEDTIENLLVRHDVKRGDVFFIPGGLVHAIGRNLKLFEVQQNSNTTFRLFDWNRMGASGETRELHIEESLKAIDYSLKPPQPLRSVAVPQFRFDQIDLEGAAELPRDDGFTILYPVSGQATLNGAELARGRCVLVPEGEPIRLSASGAKILVTKDGAKLN